MAVGAAKPERAPVTSQCRKGRLFLERASQLYVAPIGGRITGHTFDVITRSAFYFDGRHPVAMTCACWESRSATR